MHVSEIMGSRALKGRMRRVGVEFPPEERHRVMAAAVDLYRELGVDVEVEGQRLFVSCGQGIAAPLMGLLERRTGRHGFNEWWT
jgi:diphthamide synthase subunit DPH2